MARRVAPNVGGRIPFFLFVLIVLAAACPAQAAGTQALFDLSLPAGGPFPSDRFTVPDDSHNTGLRVNLPMPQDCAARPSDCGDVNTLNTLDGFNLQPRLSIPFSGPIDVSTVTSDTVFLVAPNGRRIGINQVVWDVESNTLHVESDELLDQHTQYVFIVTREVRDAMNEPVEAAGAFQAFRHGKKLGHADDDQAVVAYRKVLIAGLERAVAAGAVDRNRIAVASVFTTQSITAILEKIRDQIKAATPEPADFALGAGSRRSIFSLSSISSATTRRHLRTNPDVLNPPAATLGLDFLRQIFPGAVGQLAFGKYRSPDYLTPCPPAPPCDRFILPVGTRTGNPEAQGAEEIFFNLFVPSGERPATGWPVVLVGSGNPNTKEIDAIRIASTMAAHGIATMAINAVGLGLGPLSTLSVTLASGETVTFPSGGRSSDQDGDGRIGAGTFPTSEGAESLSLGSFISRRDALRQTVVDYMQLVRIIEVGVDLDGDGIADLDPSRIYYYGFSHGADHGTMLTAIEPSVRAAVLTAAGGNIESFRLALPTGNRTAVGGYLDRREPSLLNTPGIEMLGSDILGRVGVPLPPAFTFNENLPLRNGEPLSVRLTSGIDHVIQSPVVNTVSGAMEIQRVLDYTQWLVQANDPSAYAPYLRKQPLEGNPPKRVIIQMSRGDQTTPNPANTALLRAGDLKDRATYFRNDLAFFAANPPLLTKNPHGFAIRGQLPAPGPARDEQICILRQAQAQVARFFASDGTETIDPDEIDPDGPVATCITHNWFEAPIEGALPEDLGFIP